MNALITGASKGIGRAVAFELASKGYSLFITARSSQELEALRSELLEIPSCKKVYCYACDLEDRRQIDALAEAVLQSMGSLYALINNAGRFLPGNIVDEELGNMEGMMRINFESAYHLTRAILPQMLKHKRGHIFNMCSVASLEAYPGGSSYCISKFALFGFSKCLREELKNSGIKVTAVLPGATWSDSWKGVDLPKERLMEAADVARAIGCALDMGPSAVVEEIIMRPQAGDL
ncbi:MAG: SDR family oxidoreductase [Saprospiraceae bacterium]|jgi:short-subunit dehydrogenase|nr:SDR family oxidoreductase [Saprospiraceae bacterium]MBP9210157.1 SDR family oxidoreductase [Saprospiraceae bacterium]MBV6473496.1 putative oxidoreductase [Saprospiraceae bacterium]